MLYYLYKLSYIFHPFNLFRYISFRTVMAMLTALFLSLILGHIFIKRYKHLYHPNLLDIHKEKEKVPTMGGIIILASIFTSVFLWADLMNIYILLLVIVLAWLGIFGYWDDAVKLSKKSPKGLRPLIKIIGQFGLGFLVGFILYYHPVLDFNTKIYVPFFKKIFFHLGPYYILFTIFIITATSNAVNVTDGLDGLAIGSIFMAAIVYGIIAYVVGNAIYARYLNLPLVQGAGEVAVFCGSLMGASIGFLWYNCFPAEMFMGDVGSLSLGGILGLLAIIVKQELSLIIVCGVFVIEAASVVLQVASFKIRGKRIFLMTPLHHHFELKGWSETKVVIRFWILAIIFALFTIVTLKIR
ncbi:MAG: phospho-N-acetylmuramoyl-pentapeptide-transferase [Candidatus Omnitrophica bacterium]|nr:phospho-N-acetylmuramoyl-pentapeptide-transferase [Candidatus Omnitrophota bacterium]